MTSPEAQAVYLQQATIQFRFNNCIPYSPEATAAVVTKDVPANAIVGGNPARLIKMIEPKE